MSFKLEEFRWACFSGGSRAGVLGAKLGFLLLKYCLLSVCSSLVDLEMVEVMYAYSQRYPCSHMVPQTFELHVVAEGGRSNYELG